MVRASSILFLVFAFVQGWTQQKSCDCSKYFTGSFYTIGPEGANPDTLFIERTATMQTEIVGTDYNKKNHVIWLSSCKYILRDLNQGKSKKKQRGDVIVQIIETTDDYYVVKAWAPHKKKLVMTVYVNK